jgi:two-component system sensor histidine kinase MprB
VPLRRRLTLVTAAAVAVAVVLACVASYLAVTRELHDQIDTQLNGQATGLIGLAAALPPDFDVLRRGTPPGGAVRVPIPGPRQGGPGGYVQFVSLKGRVVRQGGQSLRLPVDARDRAIATGRGGRRLLRDVDTPEGRLRVLTVRIPDRGAVQIARPLAGTDRVLRRLRLILLLVCLGGVTLAAVLGRLTSRNLMAPIAEVADAAAHVEETDDLGRRIAVRSGDEVGQLAARFNTMLDRLESSRGELADAMIAQRRLIADASHELRTPVTSLRTNIEVLLRAESELDAVERQSLLDDVREQTQELGALVGDLIELARGDVVAEEPEPVRLDHLARTAVQRAARHAPRVSFDLHADPVTVDGTPDRLARALNNLLDNAARHSPDGATVEVRVGTDGFTVRDHGDGIADEDLPRIFDRFYRGTTARGRDGTGLGLAIVRQVADQHAMAVEAANADDGGAIFTLRPQSPRRVDSQPTKPG